MTHNQYIARNAHRRATALLLAAVALPSMAYAQETVAPPIITVPVQPAPTQPPIVATPNPVPAIQTPAGSSTTPIAPGVAEAAAAEARETAAAQRASSRRAQAARPASVVQRAAPVAAAPVASPVAEPVAPIAAEPVAPPVEAAPVETSPPVVVTEPVVSEAAPVKQDGNASIWMILAGLGLAAAAIAAFMLLRRRSRHEDVVDDDYIAEPVQAAPLAVAPLTADPVAAVPLYTQQPEVAEIHDADAQPALEHATMTTPDADDIDAVLGGAEPHGNRPQLELAVRPMRAGVNRDEAVVEFELTVANAGGVAAQDVRIGAFMLSGRPGQNAEIERMLTDLSGDFVMPPETIEPGDGKRLDASLTVPRDNLHLVGDRDHEGFTPVLVADARYRLPDGSEGRTAAAFTIGRVNGGEALVPFALDDEVTMYADIEARLHSVPAKV